jgi:hypothetical protein
VIFRLCHALAVVAAVSAVIWHHRYMLTIASDQVEQVSAWLESHNFKLDESCNQTPDAHVWIRDCCRVRVRKDEQDRYFADVRAGTNPEWTDLGQLLSGLDQDPHWLVRCPLDIAVSHLMGGRVSKTPSRGKRLYAASGPRAYFAKVALQMIIGIGTVTNLCWAVIRAIELHHHGQVLYAPTARTSILIITAGLAAAAAVELAYTLFTPGPDEALEPLMLGLSAGILLLVTRPDVPVAWQFLGTVLGVLALGLLFLIRRQFLKSEEP